MLCARADRKWQMPKPADAQRLNWSWELGPNHWMAVTLRVGGLRYIGSDWSIQSGGDYSGGFQSFAEFDRAVGLQAMRESIAAEIAQRIATLPRIW